MLSGKTKLLLTALAAAMTMSLAIGSASAQRLSVSSTNFRAIWTDLDFVSGAGTISCPVTLTGSFHRRTIAKIARSLIGAITNAQVGNHGPGAGNCTGGGATVNRATLPWHLTYDSFRGTLPRIETIILLLIGARFEFDTEGAALRCNATTSTGNPARGIAALGATGSVTSLTADLTATIPITGDFGCGLASPGRFGGESRVDNTAAGLLFITLI